MSPRKRVLLLICIMAAVTIIVEVVTINLLYRTTLAEERARLVETAKSQARLIGATARFDAVYNSNYPEGPQQATLSQVVDAHMRFL